MGQLTVHLDTETAARVKAAAKTAGVSQSRWVADLIRERTRSEWPAWVVDLVGSWPDLPSLEEIREPRLDRLPQFLCNAPPVE